MLLDLLVFPWPSLCSTGLLLLWPVSIAWYLRRLCAFNDHVSTMIMLSLMLLMLLNQTRNE